MEKENTKNIFNLEKKYAKQIENLRYELNKLQTQKDILEEKYNELKDIEIKNTQVERDISKTLTESYMNAILNAYKKSIGLRVLKEEMKNKEIEHEKEYSEIMSQINSLIKDIKEAYNTN